MTTRTEHPIVNPLSEEEVHTMFALFGRAMAGALNQLSPEARKIVAKIHADGGAVRAVLDADPCCLTGFIENEKGDILELFRVTLAPDNQTTQELLH